MGQFQLFPLTLLLVINIRHIVGTPTPNLTCYFGPNQNVDDLDPFLCTKIVANAIQAITQEGNEPRIDINSPRLAKLVALKIVNPELQLLLGIDAPNTQALLQNPAPDALAMAASQFGRLLTAVLMDGIDFEYAPPSTLNATQDLTRLFSTFHPIFAPLIVSLTVQDSFGPTPALSKLNIDHVHVLPSAKPSLTPEREDRQILAKMEPWLKTGFQGSQLSVGLKIGGVSWRQDVPQGPYVIAVERVSRSKICRTLQMPDWQSTVNLTNSDNVLAVAQSADGRQKFTYPSEKKISKLIQKVTPTVGGVAVVDVDLDDAQNECGKGPWAFTKLVRNALKLPPLKEQGGVTRIRLKLNLGTLQNVGIFRWLNDDTETPLKRTRRHDSWPRRDKIHDDFSDNRQPRWHRGRYSERDNDEEDSYTIFPRSRKVKKGKRKYKKHFEWSVLPELESLSELESLPELRNLDGPVPATEQPNGDQQVTTPNATTTTETGRTVTGEGEASTTTTTKVPDLPTTTLQSTTVDTATSTIASSNSQNDNKVSTAAGEGTDNQVVRTKRSDKLVWTKKDFRENKFNNARLLSLGARSAETQNPKKDLLVVPSVNTDSRAKRAKRETDLWPKQNRHLDRFNDHRQPRWHIPFGSKKEKLEEESYKTTRHLRKGRRGGRNFPKPNSGEIELRSLLGPNVAEPEVHKTTDKVSETTTTTTITTEAPVQTDVVAPRFISIRPRLPVQPELTTPYELPAPPPIRVPSVLPSLTRRQTQPKLPSLSENAQDPDATPKFEEQDKPGNDPNIKLRMFEELPSKRGKKRFFTKPGPQDFNTRPFRRQSRSRRSPYSYDSPDFNFEESTLGKGGETQADPSSDVATDPANMSYYLTLVSDPQARTSATRNVRTKREASLPLAGNINGHESNRHRASRAVLYGKVRHPGLNAPQAGGNEGQVDIVLRPVITTPSSQETTTDARPKEVKLRGKVIKLPSFPDSSEANPRCDGGYAGHRRAPAAAYTAFYGIRAGYGPPRYRRSPTVAASAIGVVHKPNIVIVAKNGPGEQKPGHAKQAPGEQGIDPRNKKQGQVAKQGAAKAGKPELRKKNGNRQKVFSVRPGVGHLRHRRIRKTRSKNAKAEQQTTVKSNPVTTPVPPVTTARPSLRSRVRREIKKVPYPVKTQFTPQNNLNKCAGPKERPLAVVKPARTQRVVPSARPKRDVYQPYDPEETDFEENFATSDDVTDTGYQAFPEQEFQLEDQEEPIETYFPPEEYQDELAETYFPPAEIQDEPIQTDLLPEDYEHEARETDFQQEDLNDPGLILDHDLETDDYIPEGSRKSVNSFEAVEPRNGTKINREVIREKIRQQLQAAAASKKGYIAKHPRPMINRTRTTTIKLAALKKPLRLPIRATTKKPPYVPLADQGQMTTEPPTSTTTTAATTSSPTIIPATEKTQSRYVNRVRQPSSVSNWLNRKSNRKTAT